MLHEAVNVLPLHLNSDPVSNISKTLIFKPCDFPYYAGARGIHHHPVVNFICKFVIVYASDAGSREQVLDDALRGFFCCYGCQKTSMVVIVRRLTRCLQQPALRNVKLHCLGRAAKGIVIVVIKFVIAVRNSPGSCGTPGLCGCQDRNAWCPLSNRLHWRGEDLRV